jgi:hypothetical protein
MTERAAERLHHSLTAVLAKAKSGPFALGYASLLLAMRAAIESKRRPAVFFKAPRRVG